MLSFKHDMVYWSVFTHVVLQFHVYFIFDVQESLMQKFLEKKCDIYNYHNSLILILSKLFSARFIM